jgi:hypothetical protein
MSSVADDWKGWAICINPSTIPSKGGILPLLSTAEKQWDANAHDSR